MRKKRKQRRLTQRQFQCLVLVARGRSEVQIARQLGLAANTVHKHIEAAKKRYRVRSRVRLVVRALLSREMKLAQIA